ncbi:MAG TPA: hypothetical protein VFI29_14635, partial [Hanamia sp.]|nr:hypothetical protein [Hanamia sp.]
MLENFLTDLEELLHSAPYSSVDILPLVKKYTDDKNDEESVKIRLRIIGIIEQLKTSDIIQTSKDLRLQLVYQIRGQFLEDPIYVRGTINSE